MQLASALRQGLSLQWPDRNVATILPDSAADVAPLALPASASHRRFNGIYKVASLLAGELVPILNVSDSDGAALAD